MNTEDTLQKLVAKFGQVLNTRQPILECFCRQGVQLEGWLKGELLYYLDSEKAAGRLAHIERESRFGKGQKRVDFRLAIESRQGLAHAWLEIKHWLIGQQKCYNYDTPFYFGDASSAGIKPDAEKLHNIPSGEKFILVLSTANPGTGSWFRDVLKFNRKFEPLELKALTDPNDFPPAYFLGLLKVIA